MLRLQSQALDELWIMARLIFTLKTLDVHITQQFFISADWMGGILHSSKLLAACDSRQWYEHIFLKAAHTTVTELQNIWQHSAAER